MSRGQKRRVLDELVARLKTVEGARVILNRPIDPEHDMSDDDPEVADLAAIAIDDGEGDRLINREAAGVGIFEWVPRVLVFAKVGDIDGDRAGDAVGSLLGSLSDLARDIILAVMAPSEHRQLFDQTLGKTASDIVPTSIDLMPPAPGSVVGCAVVGFSIEYVERFYIDEEGEP